MACMPPADLLGLERRRIRSQLCTGFEPGEPHPPTTAIQIHERRATIGLAWTCHAIPDVRR